MVVFKNDLPILKVALAIESLQLTAAVIWTRKQTVSPRPRNDGLWLQNDSSCDLRHQPSPQRKHTEPFWNEHVLFQALHRTSPAVFASGFDGERKEYSSTATKPMLHFFPHLRQLSLHTCFSLYRQAPSFLVCFTIFPVTLRTPGSYSNIRSQFRPFKFTAHMLQLTRLRDPNTTTPKETRLHFTFQLYFSFSGIKHFSSNGYWGRIWDKQSV